MEVLKSKQIDLLFLDIEMPLLSGMDFAKSLTHPPAIIFTTTYREYAAESYELNVVDYLMKPISFPRFIQSVNRFIERNKKEAQNQQDVKNTDYPAQHIFINSNKKFTKASFSKIRYIESEKEHIKIQLKDRSLITKEKISKFANKLPASFSRIHRSFIVNGSTISAFPKQELRSMAKTFPLAPVTRKIFLKS